MITSKINKRQLRDDFSRAAGSYDAAAVVQHAICDRTLERVDTLAPQATCILDIGSGSGRSLQGLQSRFPNSSIIACDIALPMLLQCRKRYGHTKKLVCGDAERLPFTNETVDLIFSTSTFQWCPDLMQVLSECRRVMRPGGVLIFSTFGPDTLLQLRNSWAQVDDGEHVHEFIDMHYVGDMLLATEFIDPVVDMEIINIQYRSLRQLLQDLKDTGSRGKFSVPVSSPGLMGKQKYRRLVRAYEKYRHANGSLLASYEVIYGYARKLADDRGTEVVTEVKIPLSKIKKT